MKRISFIGDVMLGRKVGRKYSEKQYNVLSEGVLDALDSADILIANLESPVTLAEDDDSLKFGGKPDLLKQFKCVDCFSLSNNHINDFGVQGMDDTIRYLDCEGIHHNGLYTDRYEAFKTDFDNEKIAVVMCTDMMNIEFDETCPYKTLRVNNPRTIASKIHKCKQEGYFTILFAHIGMLFSRFPNPTSREFLHKMVNEGADCIVTAHSHCLGCHELYKGVHIFHSIGDFLMDGASYRRRIASILSISIENNQIVDWSIQPTLTNLELQVVLPDEIAVKRILKQYCKDSLLIDRCHDDYKSFYKRQYRKDMILHSLSTIMFEFKSRGLKGFFHILRVRFRDVFGMVKRVVTDRSNMAYDTDGVDSKHKLSNKDIQ